MYNDYYLQEISNKLSVTNNNLDTIISNQHIILNNQQLLISGDNYIIDNIKQVNDSTLLSCVVFCLLLMLYFIVRVFK